MNPFASAISIIKRGVDPGIAAPKIGHHLSDWTYGFDDRGATDLKDSYYGLVFAFLNFRANEFAAQMARVQVERQAGSDKWDPVQPNHPWTLLLKRPSRWISPLLFWNWGFQVWDGQGHADWLVGDDLKAGVPVPGSLYPLYPDFGTVYPNIDATASASSFFFARADGLRLPLEARDIVRVARVHPTRPSRTASIIEASAFHIDEESASTIYSRDVARGAGWPGVYLSTEAELDPDEARRLSRDFARKYHVRMVKSVPVADGGLKVNPLQLHNRDMQFLESRDFTQSRLFQVWNVQEGLFSDTANRANADAARYAFARYTVLPAMRGFLDQLEFAFETIFNVTNRGDLRLSVPDPIPIDPEQRATIDDKKLRNGTLTINEVRQRDGLKAIPGGDVPMTSAGLVPVSDVGAIV